MSARGVLFMRKNVFGRQFKRDKNERTALFKNLISSLVLHERIRTTTAKAKAIKGSVDKLVTNARKSNKLSARKLVAPYLSHEAIEKFLTEITPRFEGRMGGYTRIIKLGIRTKDGASMAFMEWVEKSANEDKNKQEEKTKGAKSTPKEKVKKVKSAKMEKK